jgi:DNA-binding response OmpR family regulator
MTQRYARILVVEDSEEVRELLVYLLQSEGYVVDSCVDAEQALAQARRKRPDLILTDLMLGTTSGLELITKLRSDLAPPVPPIIVCSGFTGFEGEAFKRGALAFVPKPFEANTIRKTIASVLERRAVAEREREEAGTRARAMRATAVEAARIAVARLLPQEPELTTRARWMTEFVARYFGFGEAFVAVLEGETLQVRASSNQRVWKPQAPIDLALCHDVLETGSALLVPDLSSLGATVRDPSGELLRFFTGVPLLSGRIAVGTFCFVDRAPRHFGSDGYSLLETFGRRGSALLSGHASEAQNLWTPSGLLTREGLSAVVTAELARMQNETQSLSVFAFAGHVPSFAVEERTAIGELGDGHFAAVLSRDSEWRSCRAVVDFIASIASADGFTAGGLVNIEDGVAWTFQPGRIVLAAEGLLERAMRGRRGSIERIVIRREPLEFESAAEKEL